MHALLKGTALRECPEWFQAELTRIGGVNCSGEPVFKLIWSLDNRSVIGGKWADGFEGYKTICMTPEPCWLLMVWEPAEVQGSYEQWIRDFRDEETGLLQCGGYPKYGRYRVLQRFIHTEIIQQAMERHYLGPNGEPRIEVLQARKVETHRMEPRGIILDLMLPMLMAWRKLADSAKIAALRERERQKKEAFANTVKDARAGFRIRRGSQLVQKKAEIIERGMRQAMQVAARSGLGMKVQPI